MGRTLDAISFMANHLEPNKIRAAIKCMLIELDIPAELMGYRCMQYIMPLYLSSPEASLTKELYIATGRCFEQRLSGEQVEKLIRYAIGEAWKRRDTEIWHRYFPWDKKPTNGEFLYRLAEMLDLWQECIVEAELPTPVQEEATTQ